MNQYKLARVGHTPFGGHIVHYATPRSALCKAQLPTTTKVATEWDQDFNKITCAGCRTAYMELLVYDLKRDLDEFGDEGVTV